MNLIELRNELNQFIDAGLGQKKVGIAMIDNSEYDEVRCLDVSSDFTTILILANESRNE